MNNIKIIAYIENQTKCVKKYLQDGTHQFLVQKYYIFNKIPKLIYHKSKCGNILIGTDKNKIYSLTKKGEKELAASCNIFCKIFYDVKEMIRLSDKL